MLPDDENCFDFIIFEREMEYMKKMKQMPSEKPALTATVGSRETEGVAGAFPPRIDRGDREGRRRSGHTQPCFGSAFALLAFCHDAWRMVVMVVKDQSCRGLRGLGGGWVVGAHFTS